MYVVSYVKEELVDRVISKRKVEVVKKTYSEAVDFMNKEKAKKCSYNFHIRSKNKDK